MNGNSNGPKSLHFRIARNMSWLFGFLFLAKAAAALKEMVIAWRFGVGDIADSYVFAMAIILWFPVLLQSLLTSVAVPVLILADREGDREQDNFQSEFTGLTIAAGLLWAMVLVVAALLGLQPDSLGELGGAMLLKMAVVGAIASISAGLAVRLLSRERFGMNIIEGVPALLLILVVAFAPSPTATVLISGTILGYVFYIITGLAYARSRVALAPPRVGLTSRYWPVVLKGLGIMLVSQIVMSLTNIVDPWMTAEIATGEVAALGYANRVVGLLLTLGGTLVANSIFPVLSEIAARDGSAEVFAHANRWSRWSLLVGGLILLIGWLAAPIIISVLFERGAFTSLDTRHVSSIFRAAVVQVPFFMAGIILVQALASTRNYRWIATGAFINVIVKLTANILLAPMLGAAGIALGTALMYATSYLFLMFAVHKSVRRCV